MGHWARMVLAFWRSRERDVYASDDAVLLVITGTIVREVRELNGWSRSQMAGFLHVAPYTVRCWESRGPATVTVGYRCRHQGPVWSALRARALAVVDRVAASC